MKKIFNIIYVIFLLSLLYYGYDKLFDMYSYRTIVFVFFAIVILTILYFSLRRCFVKDESE